MMNAFIVSTVNHTINITGTVTGIAAIFSARFNFFIFLNLRRLDIRTCLLYTSDAADE